MKIRAAYRGMVLRQLSIRRVKYEDDMLILGQNYIFSGHCVFRFSLWFLQLTAWIFNCMVFSQVSLLPEPGAVI